MDILLDRPEIASALISGIVSFIIAGFSGLFVVLQSRRRLSRIKDEVIAESRARRIIEEAKEYREKYKFLETNWGKLLASSPEDHTLLVQHIFDFFNTAARHYYTKNREFLGDGRADRLLSEISAGFSSGGLSDRGDPRRMATIKTVVDKILEFSSVLNEKSRQY